ncbi:carbon monoxide dehydrogenase subunit G [Halohasta litchfieldiae]|jgi:carbon monoxide dehydrogenase subunit G|uniref:Carbon monoxide dehydrogenase subunit G n=1 Tax=Halohasta litchfieldiae TaxID=1073996 RepID=A0A1H6SG40_9EURY|nr:SRPBCC family protein [Halohasta litchfieldiae]ATW89909.1 carbon monoxide dehydrogenase subunit G [Halohasta litchfieldiae]SEI66893.1 Carbon monoxide dehydrogenase subunit G [Halohasta litchfieldiae]
MTVRVSRSFEFDVPGERVWEFIADPEKRAGAISVVDSYELRGENRAIWQVKLPIPLINSTITVKTEDVLREPPHRVKFSGRSKGMNVTGEHTITDTDTGCRLTNEFVVDGKLPGVEKFFKRNLDTEIDNLEDALRADIAADN